MTGSVLIKLSVVVEQRGHWPDMGLLRKIRNIGTHTTHTYDSDPLSLVCLLYSLMFPWFIYSGKNKIERYGGFDGYFLSGILLIVISF